MLLNVMTSVYYADGYEALPTLPAEGTPVLINDIVLAPNGRIYVSFSEIPAGSGMNFSVMVFDSGVSVEEQNNLNFIFTQILQVMCFTLRQLASGDIVSIYDMQGRFISSECIATNALYSINAQLAEGSYCVMIQRGQHIHTRIVHVKRPITIIIFVELWTNDFKQRLGK